MYNIVVWDCGAGGMGILSKLISAVVADYRYFSDVDCDYSAMASDQLVKTGLQRAAELINDGTDAVIITDSNMTCACIGILRKKYPDVLFVGYEPPVQHAVQYTVSHALVLCSEFVKERVGRQQFPTATVCVVDEDKLCYGLSKRAARSLLESALLEYEGTFDCIALGNSRYWLFDDVLRAIFPAVKIFDGGDGVVSRVKKMFKRKNREQESTLKLTFSSNEQENRIKYCKMVGEIFKYY